MTMWFWVVTVVFVIVAVVMVLIILVQRPQGGGLAGAFGGAGGAGTETVFGGRVGDALTVATVLAFVVYLALAIALNLLDDVSPAATTQPAVAQTIQPPTTVPAIQPVSTQPVIQFGDVDILGTPPSDVLSPATAPTTRPGNQPQR
ncbi:MAG: preprotein translocase subunit SecG [Planctomycetota bacterium]|nr:preprotein translocase subunit SecG [Planctomycetota bacterium]